MIRVASCTAMSALAKHAKGPSGSSASLASRRGHNDVHRVRARFKGLGAPVVVLCEMGHLRPEAKRSSGTPGSRARVGLFVLARGEAGDDRTR